MVKKIVILIFLVICNLSIAQKQIVEKTYSTEYYENCKEVTIPTGKPIFILVYINNSIPNDSLIAVREFNELKKNFKGPTFYYLGKRGKINVNNTKRETVTFDALNEEFGEIIYWDGKKESELIEYQKLVRSSEYFSEILNVSKTSSYIDDYNNQLNNFNNQKVWKPNEGSKELSNKYLKKILSEQFQSIDEFSEFLHFDFTGLKKLVINSNVKGAKNPWQEVYFDKEGLPTKAIVSNHSDGRKIMVNYEYKEDLLSNITISYKSADGQESKYSTSVFYSGKDLMTVSDSRIIFYNLNSGFLTYKSYYMNESNFEFLIDTYELVNSKELKYTESGGLNNYTMSFNSKEKKLPVIYTLRPEGDKYHKHISVLSKKDDLNYVVTQEKVDYIKIKYLNKNLISEVLLIDPDDISGNKKMNQYKFDFKYEYYK